VEVGMNISDKILYYSGIVGIVAALVLGIGMAVGAFSTSPSAIGHLAVAGAVGIGVFARGYRAKQEAQLRKRAEQFQAWLDAEAEHQRQEDSKQART